MEAWFVTEGKGDQYLEKAKAVVLYLVVVLSILLYPSRSRDSKRGFLKSLFEGVKRRKSSFLIHMLLFPSCLEKMRNGLHALLMLRTLF